MTATNRGSSPDSTHAARALSSAEGRVSAPRTARTGLPVRPPSRVMAALAVAVILACVIAFWSWRSALVTDSKPTWFAGYVDVTVSPEHDFENGSTSGTTDVVLAFLVASAQDSCVASWGALYSVEEAESALGLDARISQLRSHGGSVSISLGGAREGELATSCRDEAQLRKAYTDVVERYDPAVVDFDLEGADLLDQAGGERRAKAVAALQEDRRAAGKKLSVWLTLPASPRGLTDAGIAAVEQMLDAGVQLAGVNIMTMNYGASRESSQGMLEAAIAAAGATHDQLSIVYQRTGTNLSSEQIWKKLGLTPMIGRNDQPGEVFSLDDARELKDYAVEFGIQRLSMWSLNRDTSCPEGEHAETASFICSGVDQGTARFAELFAAGLPGRMG